MKNKSISTNSIFGYSWYISVYDFYTNDKKNEAALFQRLINTLIKLDVASEYYEDYGCISSYDFESKVRAAITAWKNRIFNIKKFARHKTWKIVDKNSKKITDLQTQSRRSTQDQALAALTCTYLYPSSCLVDSS